MGRGGGSFVLVHWEFLGYIVLFICFTLVLFIYFNLILVEDDIPVDEKDVISRGPRIKHVCRRAAVVLGLPRATFADVTEPKESFSLSALPEEEKQKILETVPAEEKVNDLVETGNYLFKLQ